jgi:hypothetical protein
MQLLPTIDANKIATWTDWFQALQSVLQTELVVDYMTRPLSMIIVGHIILHSSGWWTWMSYS